MSLDTSVIALFSKVLRGFLSKCSWEYQRVVDESKERTSSFSYRGRFWEGEKETERVERSLAAVMVNFSPVHLAAVQGFSATMGPWDPVLGGAGRACGPRSRVCVCVFACVPLETAVQLIFPPRDLQHLLTQMTRWLCPSVPAKACFILTSDLLSHIPQLMFTLHALLGLVDILLLE